MRARLLALLIPCALVATSGCATQRRRVRRAKPVEAKPKRPEGPVWFTPEGTADGRTRRPEGLGESATARTDRVVPRPDPDRPRANDTSPLGTNLGELSSDGRAWAFVDVFRMATPWESHGKAGADGRLVEQDPDGWVQALIPGQRAVTRIPTLGGGRFVTLYQGRGLIRLGGATVVEDVPGRLVFEAPAHRTVSLEIVTTNPTDHVREIRVVPAAFEATFERQVFHPLFLQRLSRFSVLRFAGWSRVTHPVAPTWDRRVTPRWYTQAGPRGVSYEYMAMLANELGADLWINIPHQANDEFVTKLATFLANNLEPELKVYLEYSAEVWRPGSEAGRFAEEQGRFTGLSTDPTEARLRFQARRSAEIFQLFATRFEARRLVRVVAAPLEQPQEMERLLGDPALQGRVDALAVAPALRMDNLSEASARTVAEMREDALLDTLEFSSLPELMSRVRAAQRVAITHRAALVAYAGGQALAVQPGLRDYETLSDLFSRASRNPRTQALYLALLNGWREAGGELFVHGPLITGYATGDRAGALEWLDQAEGAPRYTALMAFAQNTPRWWGPRHTAAPQAVAQAEVAEVAPDPAATQLDTEQPWDSTPAVWGAGGTALVASGMGAAFTGLALRAGARRDRLVADGAVADDTLVREQDDAAGSYSVAAGATFGVAAAGVAAALVLNGMDEHEDGARGRPGLVVSGGIGAVALATTVVFLRGYFKTRSDRNERLAAEPNPVSAAPLRNLDQEIQEWGVASAASLGVAVASLGVTLGLYLYNSPDPYLDDDYEDEEVSAVQVQWAPNGMVMTW
ncbi:MAG: hypothetical protein H6730_25695 [Deltaproteobacteria bacterium]|nr:hypothetical protein [Deltaproteobacteria bacterium]